MSNQNVKQNRLTKQVFLKLLEIKDADLRHLTLFQGQTAVDKGIHIGGAFSSIIPLTSLYYGGIMNFDVEQPTKLGQDLFVLSKGHGVAAMASVYADLGFFPESWLKGSRGNGSHLNGHPGPVLPGVHLATGPLGQGIGVAQGFALAAQCGKSFDVFSLVGDGELQEGLPWEAIMFAGAKRLDNFCVLLDKNEGQIDSLKSLLYPMNNLDSAFESFGWDVISVDATKYEPVLDALTAFKYGPRNGRPKLIICHCYKGQGGLSSFMGGHKVDFNDAIAEQEMKQQEIQRDVRVAELQELISLAGSGDAAALKAYVEAEGKKMGLTVSFSAGKVSVKPAKRTQKTKQAPARDKKIAYDPAKLPTLDPAKAYTPQEMITSAMKVFAQDPRVMSVDSDLASTSGLEQGVGWISRKRGLNAGIAEANMMNIAEGFAALGYNAWVSTFSPFFNWQVLRRIAVSYQERMEAIAEKPSWLNSGHGLDITFLATAPNLETKTNGATHMGNDDVIVYDGIAHLKIIDASCPQQVLSIMRWIMEGNRGLVYLRIMRTSGAVLYPKDYKFEFGKGTYLSNPKGVQAYIVSSGHGVYEALSAAKLLLEKGIKVGVVDMPSYDEALAAELHDSGKKMILPEQNNGYLWHCFRKTLFGRKNLRAENIVPVNLLDKNGNPRFIHSAPYDELIATNALSPDQIAKKVTQVL